MPEPDLTTTLVVALAAYLLGSLSCAVLTCRLLGLPDPRESGSGNPGATNVLRIGGRRAALLTLGGDAGKGLLAVLAVRALGLPVDFQALAALGVVLGHLFPLFFRFRGGKGVATALGACLALYWPLGAAQLLIWLCLARALRISSVAAIGTALASPPLYLLFAPWLLPEVTLISLLLLIRHQRNIRNLLRGQESRL